MPDALCHQLGRGLRGRTCFIVWRTLIRKELQSLYANQTRAILILPVLTFTGHPVSVRRDALEVTSANATIAIYNEDNGKHLR